jgi:hypothetical protein
VLIVCDGITCVSRDDSCIIVSGFTLKFSHVRFLSFAAVVGFCVVCTRGFPSSMCWAMCCDGTCVCSLQLVLG